LNIATFRIINPENQDGIADPLHLSSLRFSAPYLAGLDEQAGSAFLTRYLALLAAHYPLQCNGKVLLRFPRLFIVARKIAA
jgi:trans-aconitate methyltransferase